MLFKEEEKTLKLNNRLNPLFPKKAHITSNILNNLFKKKN